MVRLGLLVPNVTFASMATMGKLVVATVVAWHDRVRQRRHLARLDDKLLKDIGLTRVDAENEASKPFWKE